MDFDLPGHYVAGSLERLELVSGGRFPGFWQMVICETPGGHSVRATFNEVDRDSKELTQVWSTLKDVEASGQWIVVRVAGDRVEGTSGKAARLMMQGASEETIKRALGGWVNYRALRVVELRASRQSASGEGCA